MIRSKKLRSSPSRCRMVVVDNRFPRLPGRAACHSLKPSMWRRSIGTPRTTRSVSVTWPAKKRRDMSKAPTVEGRAEIDSWSR